MPVVVVPAAYRGPTAGHAEIEVDAVSVIGCLRAVDRAHPGFLELILDRSGSVHRFVRLFVNEKPLDRGQIDAPVGASDRIEVLAAIAGG